MRTRSIASGLAALTLLAAALSCQNINVDTEKVDPCTFDHAAGKYSAPFDLEIENDDPAVEIWYTDDGTIPSDGGGTSQLYNDVDKVPIDQTTTIRAKGYKAGLRASDERSATFTFVWTRGADMAGVSDLLGRYDFACTSIGSRIFIIGGRERVSGPVVSQVSTVLVYDVDATENAWSTISPISGTRQGMDAVVYNGMIYIAGGSSGGVAVGTTEEYNPGTGTWTAKGDLAIPRYGHRLAVIGDYIYAVGGENAGGLVTTVEKFSIGTGTWTNLEAAFDSIERTEFGLGVVGTKVYVFGGRNSSAKLKSCQAFDPNIAGDKWQDMEDMPVATEDLGAAVIGGRVYSLAGEQPGGIVNNSYRFDPTAEDGQSDGAGNWESVWAVPSARKNFGTAVVNSLLHCISGLIDETNTTNSVYIYDPSADD